MALLVLLVLPSDQIKLGASQLNGLIGSYTGGHYWQDSYSSKGTASWDYLGSPTSSLPWPTNASGGGTNIKYELDAATTGTVTATLTWVPATGQDSTTDPPSSSVIVTETGSAGATGGNGTASADDGWGDKPSKGGVPGSWSTVSSSGTHYEVKDGTSGTITVGPFSLSASSLGNTMPANSALPLMDASAFVSLAVAGNSLTTNPGNAVLDSSGHYNILVGQGCTASLSGIPANSTNITYNWNISGSTFQNWPELDCSGKP